MLKAASEPQKDPTVDAQQNRKLAQKMSALETALKTMNEERKLGSDDKETIMLKKKLALFESRMRELEEEKRIRDV